MLGLILHILALALPLIIPPLYKLYTRLRYGSDSQEYKSAIEFELRVQKALVKSNYFNSETSDSTKSARSSNSFNDCNSFIKYSEKARDDSNYYHKTAMYRQSARLNVENHRAIISGRSKHS